MKFPGKLRGARPEEAPPEFEGDLAEALLAVGDGQVDLAIGGRARSGGAGGIDSGADDSEIVFLAEDLLQRVPSLQQFADSPGRGGAEQPKLVHERLRRRPPAVEAFLIIFGMGGFVAATDAAVILAQGGFKGPPALEAERGLGEIGRGLPDGGDGTAELSGDGAGRGFVGPGLGGIAFPDVPDRGGR